MSNQDNKLPAPSISEIVLKTGHFDEMKDWYVTALDMEPFFTRGRPEQVSWTKSQQIAFFKLSGSYPYTQILGIFEVDGTESTPGTDPGLHHFQMAHASFDELFARYDRLKEIGVTPSQTWNHGVSTSFYYEDPDGNWAEMNCVNFDTEEEFIGYFDTEAYKKNISGIPIDPDEYIARYRGGMSRKELVVIPV